MNTQINAQSVLASYIEEHKARVNQNVTELVHRDIKEDIAYSKTIEDFSPHDLFVRMKHSTDRSYTSLIFEHGRVTSKINYESNVTDLQKQDAIKAVDGYFLQTKIHIDVTWNIAISNYIKM